MKSLKKRKFKLFNTLTILFIIICFFGLLSLVLSWADVGTEVWNSKTQDYETKKILGAGILEWFLVIPFGLINSVWISVFLFIFGSFMYLTIRTNALNAVVLKFLNKIKISKKQEVDLNNSFLSKTWFEIKSMFKTTWIMIPVMLFFSLNGTFNGMGTSSLPLYAFIVPVFLAAGFDIWTAFLIVFIGAGSGVIGSTVNPFATIIATDTISNSSIEIEKFSIVNGMAWRWVSWVVIFIVSTLFVMIYGYRVKKNKKNSYFPDKFEYYENEFEINKMRENENVVTKRKILITSIFFLSFFLMLFLVIPYDQISGTTTFENIENVKFENNNFVSWFHNSKVSGGMNGGTSPFKFGSWNLAALSMYFFIATIIIAILSKFSEIKFIETITKGFQNMMPAILCIGMASGLSVLFAATNLKDLFINGVISTIKNSGGKPGLSIPIMTYIFVIPVSLLIPSTSGLAKAMYPVLGPAINTIQQEKGIVNHSYLSSSVTAYTFAIGIGNLFAPTYAAVIVSTAFCKIQYNTFLKCIWRYLLLIFTVCLILILIGVGVNSMNAGTKISIF